MDDSVVNDILKVCFGNQFHKFVVVAITDCSCLIEVADEILRNNVSRSVKQRVCNETSM